MRKRVEELGVDLQVTCRQCFLNLTLLGEHRVKRLMNVEPPLRRKGELDILIGHWMFWDGNLPGYLKRVCSNWRILAALAIATPLAISNQCWPTGREDIGLGHPILTRALTHLIKLPMTVATVLIAGHVRDTVRAP